MPKLVVLLCKLSVAGNAKGGRCLRDLKDFFFDVRNLSVVVLPLDLWLQLFDQIPDFKDLLLEEVRALFKV